MNQELTDRQNQLLEKISKAGNFSPVGFAKKIVSFEKIRNIDQDFARNAIGMILTKASNLAGIKDPISDINKIDIREMIFENYKNFGLEEIDYAFRHDRYSGTPIEHFQLFNSEYVAKILLRYKDFMFQTKKDNNIPIGIIEQEKEVTEMDKKNIRDEFLKMVYVEIRDNGFTDSGWLLYVDIKEDLNYSKELLQRLFRIQTMKFKKSKPKNFDFLKGGHISVQNICRNIVASNYLKKHISSFDDFKRALHED